MYTNRVIAAPELKLTREVLKFLANLIPRRLSFSQLIRPDTSQEYWEVLYFGWSSSLNGFINLQDRISRLETLNFDLARAEVGDPIRVLRIYIPQRLPTE